MRTAKRRADTGVVAMIILLKNVKGSGTSVRPDEVSGRVPSACAP